MLDSLSLDPHPRYIVLDAGKILEAKLMDQRTCSQNIISFNGFIDWIFQAVFKKPGFFYWKFLATLTWVGRVFKCKGHLSFPVKGLLWATQVVLRDFQGQIQGVPQGSCVIGINQIGSTLCLACLGGPVLFLQCNKSFILDSKLPSGIVVMTLSCTHVDAMIYSRN